jgi:hypothetical protein
MSIFAKFTSTKAPNAVALIRLMVGSVFFFEGLMKFLYPRRTGGGPLVGGCGMVQTESGIFIMKAAPVLLLLALCPLAALAADDQQSWMRVNCRQQGTAKNLEQRSAQLFPGIGRGIGRQYLSEVDAVEVPVDIGGRLDVGR